MRHNRGGNIDSWVLSRLMRKAWFFWSQRVGRASNWNMQQAFRGHVVVLCDEFTASDGEAFCEGIKRLKLGKVVGTRTWGGEIWLRSNNFLVDRGIATAAEFGVFSPEGTWLIEGHGVDPDVVVDNLPHATFNGKDAQLEKAIRNAATDDQGRPTRAAARAEVPDAGEGALTLVPPLRCGEGVRGRGLAWTAVQFKPLPPAPSPKRRGGADHFPTTNSTSPTSMYCPPPVCLQWTAMEFLPSFKALRPSAVIGASP